MSTEQTTAAPASARGAGQVAYEESKAALIGLPGGVWPAWEGLSARQRQLWELYGKWRHLEDFPPAVRAMVAR